MAMTTKILVHQFQGVYYARYQGLGFEPAESSLDVVFEVKSKDDSQEDFLQLRKDAQTEARRRGIAHVVNLD
jgi:hypothetical protein